MCVGQENDHLKAIIAKIESLRPNVLLVEKSVSSYAQQYLLEKEISLVLNVKRSLLDQIARCTGAVVCPSVDSISTARLGHCELFRTEKVLEQHEAGNLSNRKPRTLMYFEGCPRRLGCTVCSFIDFVKLEPLWLIKKSANLNLLSPFLSVFVICTIVH